MYWPEIFWDLATLILRVWGGNGQAKESRAGNRNTHTTHRHTS